MQNAYIDKLAYIEIENHKVLVTRSYGKDTWYIPGGKREGNETDQEALIREVKEELQVGLVPGTIKYFGTYEAQAHGKPEGTIVRMTCYTGEYNGEVKPGAEIEKIDWFTFARRGEVSIVDQLIFDDLKNKNLIK